MKIQPILIKNARLISNDIVTPEKHVYISNGTIQLVSNHITQIEEKYDVSNALIIDATNKYLTPGLIDVHVHLILHGDHDIVTYVNNASKDQYVQYAKHHMIQSVRHGITTLRDVGDTAGILSRLKKINMHNDISLPHLFTSGEMITAQHGHVKRICHEIINEEPEIHKAIKTQLESDADFIKLIISGGMLTRDSTPLKTEMDNNLVFRLCQEAHKQHIPVAAHAYSERDISAALRGGVASVEQGVFASDANLKQAAQQNVVFVPTLKASYDILDHKDILPSFMVHNAELVLSKIKSFIHTVQQYNVALAMGTDAGTPFNFHGDNAKELQLLVENGYSIPHAIQAATSIPARLLGMQSRLGKIQPGYSADVLLLSKNPLDDITAFQKNIISVINKGIYVKR